MPHDNPSSRSGQINLEHQRKRAKSLLASLKDGTAPAQQALLRRQGITGDPCLAHAQWVVAKELGFASWPKLKAHVDAVAFAARGRQFASDDEPDTQHWRCGNDIAHALMLGGFKGSFHMFADPLSMGPAPDVPDADFLAARSAFVSSAFDLPPDDAYGRLSREYAGLADMSKSPRAVLWCDADAYDQLFLICVLAGLQAPPDKLELIQTNRVPGVERFIGMGQLAPDVLAWLWPQRRVVTREALDLARVAWQAYRKPSPQAWAEIARAETPALPFLAGALRRQLQELPSVHDGLPLTERLTLQIIDDFGQPACGQVFAELNGRREPLPFQSDLMFKAAIRPLIDSARPLVVEADSEKAWPHRALALTALGRQVLAGEAYWLDYADAERWVGGVQLTPGRPHWAIDESLGCVWRT